jgi:cytochrome c556
MKKIASTTLLLALLGTAAAYAAAHDDRVAVMRSNGAATGALRPMVAAFDATVVKTQGQILVDNAAKTKALFAAGTDQMDPGASPAIWTDAAGFTAAADKFATDAAAVAAATDGPSLQAALMAVNGDCGGCHRTYRVQAPRPAAPPPPPAQ